MPQPFDGIDEKLRRASLHVHEVALGVEAFLDEVSNRVLIEPDSAQDEAFRQFHASRQVPLAISVAAGEVL
jgi:hypothetical protein